MSNKQINIKKWKIWNLCGNYFEITSGGHKLIPTTAAVAANSMIDVILYDSTGLRVGDRKGKENREVYTQYRLLGTAWKLV